MTKLNPKVIYSGPLKVHTLSRAHRIHNEQVIENKLMEQGKQGESR